MVGTDSNWGNCESSGELLAFIRGNVVSLLRLTRQNYGSSGECTACDVEDHWPFFKDSAQPSLVRLITLQSLSVGWSHPLPAWFSGPPRPRFQASLVKQKIWNQKTAVHWQVKERYQSWERILHENQDYIFKTLQSQDLFLLNSHT